MKFSKYNNPAKRRKHRRSASRPYSAAYAEERRSELYRLLAEAKTEEQRDALIKAYNISIHP